MEKVKKLLEQERQQLLTDLQHSPCKPSDDVFDYLYELNEAIHLLNQNN